MLNDVTAKRKPWQKWYVAIMLKWDQYIMWHWLIEPIRVYCANMIAPQSTSDAISDHNKCSH